jgi:hypothetical protein
MSGRSRRSFRHRLRELAELFATISAEKLRSEVEAKAHDLAARNPMHLPLLEKLGSRALIRTTSVISAGPLQGRLDYIGRK